MRSCGSRGGCGSCGCVLKTAPVIPAWNLEEAAVEKPSEIPRRLVLRPCATRPGGKRDGGPSRVENLRRTEAERQLYLHAGEHKPRPETQSPSSQSNLARSLCEYKAPHRKNAPQPIAYQCSRRHIEGLLHSVPVLATTPHPRRHVKSEAL